MSSSKQQAVMAAAIALFAQRGLAGTTMEAVATKAKVSKRTLYKYYGGKEQLFDGVVDLLVERIRPLQQRPYCPHTPVQEQLQAVAELFFSLTQDKDYLTLSRIIIIESLRSKKRAAKLEERLKSCEQGACTWFDQAHSEGVLNGISADVAMTVFLGSLKKVAYWDQLIKWQQPIEKEKLDEVVAATSRLFTQPPLK
ncbi:TetR/AcrR family transcriptional regulator [Pseudoalteromonas sp. SSDWG2]|uniref:TetR/AcrR family transcriptional regulator n=1 Tax=Pseudoalteromonas sp. SSDWG2 TaxID=3139391 RepID=UPI003BA9E5ED